jgi:hydroxymethylpyrimidine/phosphomethylpyrimidine kinase
MCFNVNDPSGASGLAADIATVAAMGAHALPVMTGVLIRDTAEVLDSYDIDTEALIDQARVILEDTSIAAWKVGFLGSAEGVSAVAEIISDYSDIPLVAYLGHVTWLDEERQVSYLEAFKELILPATTVLVGNHQVLSDLLLPDWESERSASARELAVAAHELGVQFVLVTGIVLPDQFIDNVLATAQGALAGERFERIDTGFVGAGDTLSAALTAILTTTDAVDVAAAEALSFLDQALDAGFRPGMGQAIPDRFFWALPPADEAEGEGEQAASLDLSGPGTSPRNIH